MSLVLLLIFHIGEYVLTKLTTKPQPSVCKEISFIYNHEEFYTERTKQYTIRFIMQIQ